MLKEFPYDREYKVVVNYEEEYSILPAGKEVSADWKERGRSGGKKVCRDYLEEVFWSDPRKVDTKLG